MVRGRIFSQHTPVTISLRLPTTRAIRAWRALDEPPDQRWVEWAVRLLQEGVDTPTLRILAGLSDPLDRGEATRILDRVLLELNLPPLERQGAIRAYVSELLEELLSDPQRVGGVLDELRRMCLENDHDRTLMPFYLLAHARSDLQAQNMQHYWAGADRTNIDAIVREEAQRWLIQYGRVGQLRMP